MNHPPSDPSAAPPDLVAARDVVAMIELVAVAGTVRHDARRWRLELLAGVIKLLRASTAAAFQFRLTDTGPAIGGIVDVGFRSDAQQIAYHDELNTAPLRDPFSALFLERFLAQRPDVSTALRADLVSDADWSSNVHVLTHRKAAGLGDFVCSFHRGPDKSSGFAILAFRAAVSEPTPGSPAPGADIVAASRFTPRERVVLDTLHRGIAALYRSEEAARRNLPSHTLPPRLRETLEHLLAGLTERQVAMKMGISIHTVHDYVKTIYTHFTVSSRRELIVKWINATGKPPE